MNVLNLHSLLVICLVSFLIKQLAKLVYGFRKQFLIAGFTLVRDFMSTLYNFVYGYSELLFLVVFGKYSFDFAVFN